MGLLDKFKASSWFLRLTRILQFLSATISLALYSNRVYSLLKKIQRLRAAQGAVEGVLACAVAYTIISTIIQFLTKANNKQTGGTDRFNDRSIGEEGEKATQRKRSRAHWLRWLLVLLDVLFVGAFIAVATLTRPGSGPAGPCTSSNRFIQQENRIAGDKYCHFPLATFILAILSTILHAITAIFKDVKDRKANKKEAAWERNNADDMMSSDHVGLH